MDKATQARNKNLYRIAGIIGAIMLALSAYGLLSGGNRFALGSWITLAAACGAAIVLTRRNRRDLGVGLMLGVTLLTLPFSSFVAQGAGVFMGLIAVAFSGLCAYLAMSPRWRIWALLAGIVSAVSCLLLDVFGSPARPTPLNFTFTFIISLVVLALYAIFVLRQFPNFSLREKIIVVSLALTLVPLAILVFFNNRASTEILTQRAGVALENLADAQAQNIAVLLEQEAGVLDVLAFDSAILTEVGKANETYLGDANATQAQLERLDQIWRAADAANNDADVLVASRLHNTAADALRRFRAAYPNNVEVFVTDRYGANVAATNRTSDFYQADEAWWQAAYNNGQGAVYIGQPTFDESSQTNAINIAIPLYAADGKTVQGILRTTFSIQALAQVLGSVRLGETGYAQLLLPDNQTIGGAQAGALDAQTLDTLRRAPDRLVEINAPGVAPRFYSRVPIQAATGTAAAAISNLDWNVLARQDRAEVLAPIEAQTRDALTIALVVGLVSALIALGGAELLTRPITRLTATAEQVRAGNWQARAAVETQDEIGQLAMTFNQMTAQLSDLVGNLEQRVSDRTKELESNNAYYVSLQDMSVALLKRREVEALLQDIIERAGDLVGTKNGYVFLLDRATQEMTMRVGVGAYQELVGAKAKWGVGLAGQVWETGQALAVDDYRGWSGRLADPSRDVLRAVIGVPLKSGAETLGVIGLAHLDADKKFGPVEVEALNRFAALAALALDNAQLLDASQRELAQRQNTEQFLESVLDNLPSMLFVKDAQELKFVRWNRAGEEIMGHTRQEMLGKSDYDFLPKDIADFYIAKDRETLASGQTLDIPEEEIRSADGTMRWLRTRKTPIRGADGKPLYLLGISEDITERKRAGEREAFQTALIAAQFQISPDGILVVGADDQILSANRRFAEMWGVSAEALATDSIQAVREAALAHVSDPEGWARRSAEIYADQKGVSSDIVEFRDGRVFERYSAPVTAGDGSYLARVWFFHDITEIRRAESLVQRVTQDAHAAFWSARVTKLENETQEAGGYHWETEYANPDSIRQIAPIEVTPGQSFGDAWYATWDAGDKELMNRHSAQALRQGLDRYSQEFRFYDANGDIHWMLEEARIQRRSETEFTVTGVSTEITAVKRAEQAVREREALYRSLVDVIPQALTRKDGEGRVVFGNARYFEDTGLTPETLYGKTDFDFHPREHAEKYWQDDLRVLRDGETLEAIEPHRRGDGKLITVRVIKSPIRNLAGEIDGIQTMFWDITEEQGRQEEIKRQNAYLEALQETSVGLMQRLDVNAALQDIVTRAGQLVGTEHGYVFLREPDGDEMEMRVGVGAYEGFVGRRARIGVGLAGEVWARNEPIVVDDYRTYGGRLQDASRDILRGVAGVPLRLGGAVIGVIGLAYLDPEQKFDEQKIQALERFAQLAAIALDNARLYEAAQTELSERTRAEEALALELRQTELVNRVTSHAVSFEVDRALGEICEELASYFGAEQAGVALLSQDRTSFTVVAERHPQGGPSVVGYEIPAVGNPSAEIVMRTRKPAAFVDAQNDPRLAAIHELMATRQTASILIAPLFARDVIVGTLGIDWLTRYEITSADLDLVERVALAISTALENARLYNSLQQELGERTRAETQARQRNVELESLNRVASAMMSNEPIEESLAQMARELVTTFRARNCGIALLNSERTDLVVVADALAEEHEQRSVGIVIPVQGNPSSEYVIRNKKSLIISDPQNDPLTETIHERMRDRQMTCLAIIPLLSGDQAIGTIGLDTTEEGRVFSADEIRVAETMASQMANALEKQRLLEATQREVEQRTRAERLQGALFRIAEAVNTAESDAAFYGTLHGLIAELAYAPNLYVALYRAADDMLEFPYFRDEVDDLPVEAGDLLPAGKRITAWVIKQGRPLFGDAPTIRAMIERGEVELNGNLPFEWLGIPLKRGAETFGMFTVQSYESEHPYTSDEKETLLALAPEIANAITRRQEQAALVRRNRELGALNRITQAIAEGAALRDTLNTVAREIVATFQARNCGIALYTSDRTELEVVASANLQPDQPNTAGVRIPIAGNLSMQRVLETRQTLIIQDAQADAQTEAIHELMRQLDTCTLMIVPLLSGGEVIGTVGLDLNDPRRFFSRQDVTLAETIANQIANAIEKQRLFDQTTERARREQLTREIGAHMTRSLDLEQILQTTARELSHALGASHAVVRMGNSKKQTNGDHDPS